MNEDEINEVLDLLLELDIIDCVNDWSTVASVPNAIKSFTNKENNQ
jgi:hypothetical protein